MKSRIRYVYYDKKTGFITDILPKRKRGRGYHLECDTDEVIGFLDNSLGIRDYVVAYNQDLKKNILIKKDNIIRLREPSKNLFKIPYKKNA